MRLTLTVVAGGEPGRVWEFAPGATVRVGASAAADVMLAGDEWVAATHCAVYWHEGAWRVRDLGEGGGTWRNGVGVTDEGVESGDVIQCGRSQLRVAWVVEAVGVVGEERDPKAEALATLRALPGRLYAVLDAAKDPEVLQLLRRSGYRYECLYTGWAREVYGEAAPYLVQLRKQGRLLEQLVERGWGKGWGVYFATREDMPTLRCHLKRLIVAEVASHGMQGFRYYEPEVLSVVMRRFRRDSVRSLVAGADIVAFESRSLAPGEASEHRALIPIEVHQRPYPDVTAAS